MLVLRTVKALKAEARKSGQVRLSFEEFDSVAGKIPRGYCLSISRGKNFLVWVRP